MTDLSGCSCLACLMFSRGMIAKGVTRQQAHEAFAAQVVEEYDALRRGDAAPEEVRDRRKAMRIVKP